MDILGPLASLFPDSVTVEAYSGQNGYGDESYGTGVAYSARVVGRLRQVRTPSGEVRTSSIQAFIHGSPGITSKDRVTLPARFASQQPPVMAVEYETDEGGAHHEIVYF